MDFEDLQKAPDGRNYYSKYSERDGYRIRAYVRYGFEWRHGKQVATLTRAGRDFIIKSGIV